MEPRLLTEPPFRPREINGTLFDIRKAAENSEKQPINTIPKNVYKKSEIHEYLKNRTHKRRNFNHRRQDVPDKEVDADKTMEISSTSETSKTTCTKSTKLG